MKSINLATLEFLKKSPGSRLKNRTSLAWSVNVALRLCYADILNKGNYCDVRILTGWLEGPPEPVGIWGLLVAELEVGGHLVGLGRGLGGG